MLCTYAPLATMDSAEHPGGVCRAGCRGLQMDRFQRPGSLFRSAGSGRRKNLHGRQSYGRRGKFGQCVIGRPGIHVGCKKHSAWTRIHSIRHHVADRRPDFLRRRRDWCASGAQSGPQAQSEHYLAFERPRNRGPSADGGAVHTAALGSWRLRHRRHRHGSGNGRVSQHGQHQLLCSTTVGIVSPTQATVGRRPRQPGVPIGR